MNESDIKMGVATPTGNHRTLEVSSAQSHQVEVLTLHKPAFALRFATASTLHLANVTIDRS
jgi:hypothetical protein